MSQIEVVFDKDLKAYPNGFTLQFFSKGDRCFLEREFAEKQIERGYCKPFSTRKTKPAKIDKKVKSFEEQDNNSTSY